ncbi:MAG: glycosyltransferase [Bacteroidales bacterium]|nr:glycosyltransferase [Bacteroidales bacterium]
MILQILFWTFVLLIFHTYILFPVLLWLWSIGKKMPYSTFNSAGDLPSVSIVMAAYNEESVISEKLQSILKSKYPAGKIEILIGSDNSSDTTNSILAEHSRQHPCIKPAYFNTRQGKASIINQLSAEATSEILVLTDANVLFTENTIFELVKYFKSPTVGVVGCNIQNTNIKHSGISYQEKTYLSNENIIKYREGLLWGCMIGAFGGCYAIRKSCYRPVPRNYFMDDFYITMHVLKDGFKAINNLKAICLEDVSNLIEEEFRRKVRISVATFKTLARFTTCLAHAMAGWLLVSYRTRC